MRGFMQESRMQLILLVLTLFHDFKQYEALATKHLEIGRGPKNFTLQLNATTEIVFYFPVGGHGASYTVYVQHKPPGAHAFDRKCLLRQSREICTTSTTMCRCLERVVCKYSLRHVFTKTDEGRWLFTLQGNGSKSEEYVDITVTDASGSGPRDTIIANANVTTVIIAAASPCAIIVVVSVIVIVLSLRMRRARNAEPNASSGGKSVTVGAVSSRRQQQHDPSSSGCASPGSFSHPPQQRTPFMDASPIDGQYENNRCQQRQGRQSKPGKRRSRFDWRFQHMFSAKNENGGTPATLTTFTQQSQASNVSGQAHEESQELYANTADFI